MRAWNLLRFFVTPLYLGPGVLEEVVVEEEEEEEEAFFGLGGKGFLLYSLFLFGGMAGGCGSGRVLVY